MPVSLALNQEQAEVFALAIKGKKGIPTPKNFRNIELTRDNIVPICDAVKALHEKKCKVRTKTIDHLEICYHAEQLLDKLTTASSAFVIDTLTPNDNEPVSEDEDVSDETPIVDEESLATEPEADTETDSEDEANDSSE